MSNFQDNKQRIWQINPTIADIKRVKNTLDIDLLNLTEPDKDGTPLISRLQLDLVLLFDVIFVLVEPQAKEAQITDVAFGQAMGGQAIADATEAFWQGLSDFFQSLGRAELVQAIAKQTALMEMSIQQASEKVKMIDNQQILELTNPEPGK